MLIPSSLNWAQKYSGKKLNTKIFAIFVFFLDFVLFPLFFACKFSGQFLSQFEQSWILGSA